MAEVVKLLDASIIYPISDSQWGSPMQVMPKKSRITVVTNENNEFQLILKLVGDVHKL